MNPLSKQYRFIGSNEILPEGTEVSIRGQRGKVVKHEIVDAVPSGKIVVHTVLLTHKVVPDYGSKSKIIPLPKAKEWRGNYTAIFANIM